MKEISKIKYKKVKAIMKIIPILGKLFHYFSFFLTNFQLLLLELMEIDFKWNTKELVIASAFVKCGVDVTAVPRNVSISLVKSA